MKLEVAGHPDSVGSGVYSLWLSQRRADTDRDYLISKGVVADHLTATEYGESSSVVGDITVEDRYKNCRLELTLIK